MPFSPFTNASAMTTWHLNHLEYERISIAATSVGHIAISLININEGIHYINFGGEW